MAGDRAVGERAVEERAAGERAVGEKGRCGIEASVKVDDSVKDDASQ